MFASPNSPCPSFFTSLPGDLLIEIATFLECRSDLLHFCLTSNRLFSEVAPVLYRSVVLNSVQQCLSTLPMLKRRKDIARHVRELVIHPQSGHPNSAFVDSRLASVAVAEIAASRSLDALCKFTWSHDEIAYYEEMWLSLRMCCPRLRYLSTSVGSYFPAKSHLFNFTDLLGFSLFLAPGFYETNHDRLVEGLREDERPTSRKLWEMLFKRCPNLEELVIEGYSSFPADARRVAEGRWPHLQKLSLGDVAIDWDAPESPTTKCPFIIFLEAHTELQSLALSRHNIETNQLTSLDDTLKLTSFTGTLSQLQALPQIYPTLKSLTFRDAVWSRDVTTMTVSNLLQQLTSLSELTISFMLHSPYDSSGILRALTASCPHLQYLELVCIRRTSFHLDSFAKALPSFRRLRTLKLTLVSPGDVSLATAGARMARANPRLQNFTLTFVPPSYPHPLPNRLSPFPRTAFASSTFTLLCDAHGLPQGLPAREERVTAWPWGLGTTRRTRRYTIDLRPPSARSKPGVRGVLGILLEPGSAGDELRMFVICSVLVCLAGAFVTTSRR